MFADYKYRNLSCASKHKVPEGTRPENGRSTRVSSTQAWCVEPAGHVTPHQGFASGGDHGWYQPFAWPNDGKYPEWLANVTRRGIEALLERVDAKAVARHQRWALRYALEYLDQQTGGSMPISDAVEAVMDELQEEVLDGSNF